LDYCLLKGKL